MDALERAKKEMTRAEEMRDYGPAADYAVAAAQAYAAIAQAEQLKRIGDLFEGWMKVQGVLPEYFEAVNRIRLYEDRIYELERMMRPEWGRDSEAEGEARTDYAQPF